MIFDVCKGFMCNGNHMESGHYIGYYSWYQQPLDSNPIKELWLFTPEGKRICYFDPEQHKDWFSVYHDFDAVIGAKIEQNWISDNQLTIDVKGDDGNTLNISLVVATWHTWEGSPFEGITETNKRFKNIPNELGICEKVDVIYNGKNLGKFIVPEEPVFLGNDALPAQPVINKCTHELEP